MHAEAGTPVEIFFNGQKILHHGGSSCEILNLLLSTYDAAIQRNRELTLARDGNRAG